MQLGTNHLGHFLLTMMLLPLITDPSRCMLPPACLLSLQCTLFMSLLLLLCKACRRMGTMPCLQVTNSFP